MTPGEKKATLEAMGFEFIERSDGTGTECRINGRVMGSWFEWDNREKLI
jgi:hypothetical protein